MDCGKALSWAGVRHPELWQIHTGLTKLKVGFTFVRALLTHPLFNHVAKIQSFKQPQTNLHGYLPYTRQQLKKKTFYVNNPYINTYSAHQSNKPLYCACSILSQPLLNLSSMDGFSAPKNPGACLSSFPLCSPPVHQVFMNSNWIDSDVYPVKSPCSPESTQCHRWERKATEYNSPNYLLCEWVQGNF